VGRFGTRAWVIGGLIVVALAVASASMLVFQGRGDDGGIASRSPADTVRHRAATSTSSTTTTTTTTSTTAPVAPPSTAPPPPPPPSIATPVAAPVTPPAPAAAPACDGAGGAVVDAMNADRASAGLGGLCGSSQLAGYAQSWANWMAQHQSLTHQDLDAVLNGTSFTTVAENILDGPGGMSVADMEATWMASPPHRQNIMNGAYTAAGVGTAFSSDGRVWVAVEFGG
jgi:uncharacterized protein YkwD